MGWGGLVEEELGVAGGWLVAGGVFDWVHGA